MVDNTPSLFRLLEVIYQIRLTPKSRVYYHPFSSCLEVRIGSEKFETGSFRFEDSVKDLLPDLC